VVLHCGTIGSGHYIAIVKYEHRILEFNDQRCRVVRDSEFRELCQPGERNPAGFSPYVLVYVDKSAEIGNFGILEDIPLSALDSLQETGESLKRALFMRASFAQIVAEHAELDAVRDYFFGVVCHTANQASGPLFAKRLGEIERDQAADLLAWMLEQFDTAVWPALLNANDPDVLKSLLTIVEEAHLKIMTGRAQPLPLLERLTRNPRALRNDGRIRGLARLVASVLGATDERGWARIRLTDEWRQRVATLQLMVAEQGDSCTESDALANLIGAAASADLMTTLNTHLLQSEAVQIMMTRSFRNMPEPPQVLTELGQASGLNYRPSLERAMADCKPMELLAFLFGQIGEDLVRSSQLLFPWLGHKDEAVAAATQRLVMALCVRHANGMWEELKWHLECHGRLPAAFFACLYEAMKHQNVEVPVASLPGIEYQPDCPDLQRVQQRLSGCDRD
jgi:hypothetical protein